MSLRVAVVLLLASACTRSKPASTTPRRMPTPTLQVGSCGEPGRDGVMGTSPKVEHADRDLDNDGRAEAIVTDRSMCTADGNCYWNVFTPGRQPGECERYAGTFQGSALEVTASRGDDNMADVRSYYNLGGGRLSLETYHFTRDGYLPVDALLCKRDTDDRLECADTNH